MERTWLDAIYLTGIDIMAILIVALFVMHAIDEGLHRWLDRMSARRREAAAADAVATRDGEPQPGTPEWLDKLLSSSPPPSTTLTDGSTVPTPASERRRA